MNVKPTGAEWGVLAVLFILFATLNFIATARSEGVGTGIATAAGTIAGPMTGAIARDFQECCVKASLGLLPFALPFLGLAVGSQVSATAQRHSKVRTALWSIGWVGWFGAGIVSFGHALV